MANASRTTDHKTIRDWVTQRDGQPAFVKGTQGLLRINFPGYEEDNLENVSWQRFFEKFDEEQLQFLYDPDEKSRFNKFVRE